MVIEAVIIYLNLSINNKALPHMVNFSDIFPKEEYNSTPPSAGKDPLQMSEIPCVGVTMVDAGLKHFSCG